MPLLYVPTIYVLTLSVMALLGLLTLFAWLQNRANRPLAWWSTAVLTMAVALGLLCLRGEIPNILSLDLAYVTLFTSCGLMLEGARCFEGKPVSAPILLVGAAIWVAVRLVPALHDSVTARTVIISATIAMYSLTCAYVIWRGRAEPLLSRWPLIVLLGLGGALFLARVPLAITFPLAQAAINSVEALQSFWFAVLSTSTLLYIVAIYYLFLALTKERSEFAHKRAAMTDPLTDLYNRRAFVELASRELARPTGAMAFVVFDLDWFKRINDGYGHAMGDRVLRLFADTLRAHLAPHDVAGRLGGEEFAALIGRADHAAVNSTAERIRQTFATAGRSIDGAPLDATVSAGMAFYDGEAGFAALWESADKALYRAKALGRNRVELAGAERVPLAPDLPDRSDNVISLLANAR